MSMQNGHTSLIKHLAAAEVERLAEKRFLGGYDVFLLPLLTAGTWLFQKGALLGRARHDRLNILAKLLVGLETVGKLFAELGVTSDLAKSDKWVFWYLDRFANEAMVRHRKEPESLLALWLALLVPPEVKFRENGKAMQPTKKRIPLEKASEWADRWILTGISFGATFPDLTGKLWRQSYRIYDPDSWAQARQWGMDIPEHFTPLPLEIMEQNVLLEVASYAEEYFPELVDPLGLRSTRESVASSISG